MEKYCIIPARSGSKGLPNKNILELCGKPLCFYTIEAAIKSGLFKKENIIFTSDSEDYISLVEKYNISMYKRDEKTASDNSPSSSFLIEIMNNFIAEDDCVIFLLQPTSPFRNGKHLNDSYELYNGKDPVVSVTKFDKSLDLLAPIKDGCISKLEGIDKNYFRQKKEELYYPNGAIYISSKISYLNENTFYTKKTRPFIMDQISSIDIDTEMDLKFAEFIKGVK